MTVPMHRLRPSAFRGKALFIAGTDTDAGKTTVACLLAEHARKTGLKVGVMKPFASGSWDDTLRLRKASRSSCTLEEITPVYFKTPASAWAAALKEKRKVDFRKLDSAFDRLKRSCDVLLVEGMGGVLVPMTGKFVVADLILRWKLPVVLVARWGLGTLNHTALSLEALQRRKIEVAGLLFNQTQHGKIGFVEKTNVAYFRQHKSPPVLATVRYARQDSRRRLNWEPGIEGSMLWEGLNRLS